MYFLIAMFLAVGIGYLFGAHKKIGAHKRPDHEHKYEWGGQYLIPASAITKSSRIETSLKCHFCDHTIGPQCGEFLTE